MTTTETIPANGTKAALTYWAARVRESLRESQRHAAAGNYGLAEDWAAQAAGEAGEYQSAATALAVAQGA